MLIVILLIIIVAEALGIVLLVRSNRRNPQMIRRILDSYRSDDERESDKSEPQAGGKGLLEYFTGIIDRVRRFFLDLQNVVRKSERSGTRLSRNIQKALNFSTGIVMNAHDTADLANRLSEEVSTGSAAVEEINATLGSLKGQLEVQDRDIEKVASAFRVVNEKLREISGISSQRSEQIRRLVETSADGSEKMSETDTEIGSIRNKVNDVLGLITVINDIASTTNLLSMNAAIEAAHAGDAGRGFAVVAEEIRKLAESTAENAHIIGETLTALVEQIEKAGHLSEESGEAFSRIEQEVQDISHGFGDIEERTSLLTTQAEDVVSSTMNLQDISRSSTQSMVEMEGASAEITGILVSANEVAGSLDRSMQDLNRDARNSNLAMTEISSSFLTFNGMYMDIVRRIQDFEFSGLEKVDSSTILRRINISNLILAHINWVATARSVIDRSIDVEDVNLVDHNDCELGKWLKRPDARKEIGESKYGLLIETHTALHGTVGKIVNAVKTDDLQAANEGYLELSAQSREVVQILMTLGYDQYISWSPFLSVNIDEFDEQHKILINLIQKLYEAMEHAKGDEVIKSTLKELIEYTDYHFATEEKNFHNHGYPETDKHIEQHKSLLKQARNLYEQMEQGDTILSNEVLDFLQDWVMNHILKTDSRYSEFFRDKVIVL